MSRDLDVVVDRSSRVLDYRVVRSTEHPDLDAAVEDMMRGASLPAFPASMPQSQVEVWVAIRFALRLRDRSARSSQRGSSGAPGLSAGGFA